MANAPATSSSNFFLYLVVGLVIFFVGGIFLLKNKPVPTPAGAAQLAQCLKQNGVIFYGASWCPHCKAQKELFGGAVDQLPYVECADGTGMSKVCTDAGVQGFPTWVNKAGQKIEGEQTFDTLAAFGGCATSTAP